MINIPKFKISFWKVFQNTWLKISCISVSKFHIIKLPKSVIGDNERNIWAFDVSFQQTLSLSRGGSRATATSKMEHFVIIVNSFQPLTITTKRSILHIAAVLDPPLLSLLTLSICIITNGQDFNFPRRPFRITSTAWSVQIRSYFWSVCSCIRTEHGDLRSKSPYSVRTQENTDQK